MKVRKHLTESIRPWLEKIIILLAEENNEFRDRMLPARRMSGVLVSDQFQMLNQFLRIAAQPFSCWAKKTRINSVSHTPLDVSRNFCPVYDWRRSRLYLSALSGTNISQDF